jgi:hypothetical protein
MCFASYCEKSAGANAGGITDPYRALVTKTFARHDRPSENFLCVWPFGAPLRATVRNLIQINACVVVMLAKTSEKVL